MFSFFFEQFVNDWEETVYRPTTTGYILLGVIMLAIVAGLIFSLSKKGEQKERFRLTTKQMTFCAASLAIAFVLSMFKAFELPFGGSVTYGSMLFVTIIGYWFGLRTGLLAGFTYGMLQFIIDPVFYSIPQMICDYPLAFGALGLSGLLRKGKLALPLGYLIGVVGRYVFAVISGVVFFYMYAGDQHPFIYSITYNASYIVPEALITLILISLPPVAKAFAHIKAEAYRE